MQVLLVRAALACALAVFSLLTFPASVRAQPVNRAAVGDAYGEAHVVLCPPHQAVIGLREVVGYWLYMIRPACSSIDAAGNPVGTDALAPAELSNESGLAAHGIWDFTVLTAVCPAGMTVAAFDGSMIPVVDAQVQGAGAFMMPGFIRPYCRVAESEELARSTNMVGWRPPANQPIPWASVGTPQRFALQAPDGACEFGWVAVGVWGHADQWLRSVGLVCQRMDEVRPRTVVERGADRIPEPRGRWQAAEVAAAPPHARIALSGSLQPCLRYEVESGAGVAPDAQLRPRAEPCAPAEDPRAAAVAPANSEPAPARNICEDRPQACRVRPPVRR